jgi:putative transposase
MRKIQFVNGDYYHVFNRGVERRNIFASDSDRHYILSAFRKYETNSNGEKIVEINAFCLMNNHYHLHIRQLKDGGISRFMHRVFTAYVMYFNRRHARSGRLFESVFKAIPVVHDGQLAHLVRYIHLNPVQSMIEFGKLDTGSILQYAKTYRWSDCDQYIAGRGKLKCIFDDISYSDYLSQGIAWKTGLTSSLSLNQPI